MKRIWLIASDFPPLVGTNTQRVQSFVRHLGDLGWIVTVYTQDIADLNQIDSRELSRIPSNTTVNRVPDPDPFAVRSRRRGHLPTDAGKPDSESANPLVFTASSIKKNKFYRLPLILGSFLLKQGLRILAYQPDSLRLWANAVARKICIDSKTTDQILLTSSPAFSCHLAGLAIKRAKGLHWVADFRDLWVGRPYRKLASPLHACWDSHLEATVVRNCDRLILASPAWVNNFKMRYGDDIEKKLVVITNGYEPDVLDLARERLDRSIVSRDSTVRFLLTGSMHEGESPIPFIDALGVIKQANPELISNISVELVGNAGDYVRQIEECIKRNNLSEKIKIRSPRSNVECVQMQLESDCLLLFSASQHVETILGKSFEYMATGKPILACIPVNGVQAQILEKAGTATIVEHGDINATATAIRGFLTDARAPCVPDWAYIQSFDRQRLTACLATVLDELVSSTH